MWWYNCTKCFPAPLGSLRFRLELHEVSDAQGAPKNTFDLSLLKMHALPPAKLLRFQPWPMDNVAYWWLPAECRLIIRACWLIKSLHWAHLHQLHFMMLLLISGLGFWFLRQGVNVSYHKHPNVGRKTHFSSRKYQVRKVYQYKTTLIRVSKLIQRGSWLQNIGIFAYEIINSWKEEPLFAPINLRISVKNHTVYSRCGDVDC